MFSKELNKKLDKYHLLNHYFYKAWNEGKLNREIIKDYAEQYYQHVKAFPRYISAAHSMCEDLDKRKILLENLQDEENQNKDHPKLWKNFAVAMGAKKEEIDSVRIKRFRYLPENSEIGSCKYASYTSNAIMQDEPSNPYYNYKYKVQILN